jgi:hypothetical protein
MLEFNFMPLDIVLVLSPVLGGIIGGFAGGLIAKAGNLGKAGRLVLMGLGTLLGGLGAIFFVIHQILASIVL